MKVTRKMTVVFLAILLAFGFASCGDDDDVVTSDGLVLKGPGRMIITYVCSGGSTWSGANYYYELKFVEFRNVGTTPVDIRDWTLCFRYDTVDGNTGSDKRAVPLAPNNINAANTSRKYTNGSTAIPPGGSFLLASVHATPTRPVYAVPGGNVRADLFSNHSANNDGNLNMTWGAGGTGIALVNRPQTQDDMVDRGDPAIQSAFGFTAGDGTGQSPIRYPYFYEGAGAVSTEPNVNGAYASWIRKFNAETGAYSEIGNNSEDFLVLSGAADPNARPPRNLESK